MPWFLYPRENGFGEMQKFAILFEVVDENAGIYADSAMTR